KAQAPGESEVIAIFATCGNGMTNSIRPFYGHVPKWCSAVYAGAHKLNTTTLIGSRALAAYGDVDGSSAANHRPWSRQCIARLLRRSDARASVHSCAGTRSVRRGGGESVG